MCHNGEEVIRFRPYFALVAFLAAVLDAAFFFGAALRRVPFWPSYSAPDASEPRSWPPASREGEGTLACSPSPSVSS